MLIFWDSWGFFAIFQTENFARRDEIFGLKKAALRFLLQILLGCAKIRYIIKNIGDEEEEYAAGGGSERGPTAGRTLRRAGEGRFGAVPFH